MIDTVQTTFYNGRLDTSHSQKENCTLHCTALLCHTIYVISTSLSSHVDTVVEGVLAQFPFLFLIIQKSWRKRKSAVIYHFAQSIKVSTFKVYANGRLNFAGWPNSSFSFLKNTPPVTSHQSPVITIHFSLELFSAKSTRGDTRTGVWAGWGRDQWIAGAFLSCGPFF